MSSTVAAVDIGTNTLLLLVARVAGADLEILADEVRFGRLGKGLDQSGALADESINRSLEAVREFQPILERHGVASIRAVGTQALREASNARLFTEPAERLLGCRIETITGDREAELVAKAVTHQFEELSSGRILVADVGGGSTEVIRIEDGAVSAYRSLPIGSVRMTERHLRSDPPTSEETSSAVADIDAQLATFELPVIETLIGTAGTATTMAAMDLKLAKFDRDAVHGHQMTAPRIDRQLARLLELTVVERKKLPGIEPERADVIAGGSLIFSRLVSKTRARRFLVADCGVRWGLVYEMLE